MKKYLKLLAVISSFIFTTNFANAQSASLKKTTISIETDPSTFIFKGYAVHFRIQPKNTRHLVLGAGLYALDLPDIMVNLNADNKDKGWNVRINSAYALFSEYYFKDANSKWFIGLQTGIQNYKNTNETIMGKEAKYSNLLIMPSLGYNWRPFKNKSFYIKPWSGAGYTTKLNGENNINSLTYTISRVVPFVTLHVGYTLR